MDDINDMKKWGTMYNAIDAETMEMAFQIMVDGNLITPTWITPVASLHQPVTTVKKV